MTSRQALLAVGLGALVLGAILLVAARVRNPPTAPPPYPSGVSLGSVLGGESAGFARAYAPRPFRFPEDHGPHPDFRSEWWYFTGNLAGEDGRVLGFHLTVFRFGLVPEEVERPSAWAARDVYMGHLAVSDEAGERFVARERLARGALGLAGASGSPLRVWVEDWSVEGVASPEGVDTFRLRAGDGGVAIDLTLRPLKPPVLQGEAGLSQKSADPGNASYYYSYTRMEVRGRVTLPEGSQPVEGLAWMDREWSTSALAPGQVGWDWLALQLSDGQDLMYYRLRRREGTDDPASRGALVDGAGGARPLLPADLRIEVLGHWRSPRDGTRYPARWRLRVPSEDLTLEVEPLLLDQELHLSVRYWEGAVRVSGTARGQPVQGRGYVELTGYAGAGG